MYTEVGPETRGNVSQALTIALGVEGADGMAAPMICAVRFRLAPTPAQRAVLQRHCADARFVWNLALEQANYWRFGEPRVTRAERFRQLTEARHETWLSDGSCAVQRSGRRHGVC